MKNLKKLAAVILTGAMAFSLAACGEAKDPAADDVDPAKKETITVGTSADFAPYEFHKMVDGKDTILGFDMALAKQIAEDMGKELVIKDMDFNNLLTELNSGTVDFVAAGMSPDPERAKEVDFTDAYYKGGQSCMIRKEDADKYKSITDFDGKSVAAQTGSIQEKIVQKEMSGAKIVSLLKVTEEIMQLSSQKVEGVVVETAVAEGYIKQNPDLMIAPFEVPYEAKGSCLAVKKDNTELLEALNKTIAEVTTNGKMDEFVQQATKDAE